MSSCPPHPLLRCLRLLNGIIPYVVHCYFLLARAILRGGQPPVPYLEGQFRGKYDFYSR